MFDALTCGEQIILIRMKILKLSFLLLISAMMVSCSNDDDNEPSVGDLTLNISGLDDLGDGFAYEGWIIVDGAPVSTGTFTVNASGVPSQTSFEVSTSDLDAASTFVLSIEPVPDSDPAPAATKILAGDFSGNSAILGTSTVASEGFNAISGKYLVAAPTGTGTPEEEFSGIWFLDNSSGSPVAGLDLPELSAGWKYEGWVVIDGTPVTTGTFTMVNAADEASPFSDGGPAYPGEDFLMNAPSGLSFPTDIRGGAAVISIEPDPDNSAAPFTLKPLFHAIPASLSGVNSMDDNVSGSFPSGSVSR